MVIDAPVFDAEIATGKFFSTQKRVQTLSRRSAQVGYPRLISCKFGVRYRQYRKARQREHNSLLVFSFGSAIKLAADRVIRLQTDKRLPFRP